jgi:hypothetical protein
VGVVTSDVLRDADWLGKHMMAGTGTHRRTARTPVTRKAAGPNIFLMRLLVIFPMSALAPMVAVFMNTCTRRCGAAKG